jgi:single-strand selective monofunctional uracil DNA glycosylase
VSAPGKKIIAAAAALRDAVNTLRFGPPVAHVYNPLDYAWAPHELYLKKFGATPKRVLFLGMNPGPWGMAQTGVPFGEVTAARDWMGLRAEVRRPADEHPKRPVQGFDCPRREVSGERLWGLFASRFGTPEIFFREHFVVNYCPLAFLSATGSNITPDKLPARETAPLFAACDEHLRRVVEVLQPEWLVGVGAFAQGKLAAVVEESPSFRVTQILHPSPASPAANRGWAAAATKQLQTSGVWT